MIFVYSSVFKKLYEPVCLKLIKDGHAPIYNFAYSKKFFFDEPNNQIYNFDFSSIMKKARISKASIPYLSQIESKYNVRISSLLHGDRQLNRPFLKLDYRTKLAIAELTFQYAEDLISKNKFKLYWFESVGDVVSNILYTVFKYHNANILLVDVGRVPGYIFLANDKNTLWYDIEEKYREFTTNDFADFNFQSEKEYLSNFISNKLVRAKYSKRFIPQLFSLTLVRRLYYYIIRASRDRSDLISLSFFEMIQSKFKVFWNFQFTKHCFEPFPQGDFALFFLHYQPEATTLVMAPYFIDQLSLIENISKSLPAGMKLVVKEHFASIGMRPKSYYNAIKCNWNVVLLGPNYHSHELISKSKLVFTINGTSGFEAILYNKPVITFSRVCYDAFPFVIRVGDKPIVDLPYAINNALNVTFSERDILIFLYFIKLVLKKSNLVLDHPFYDPAITTEKNINELLRLVKCKL